MGNTIPIMGINGIARQSVASALFSPVQGEVLGLLFGDPSASYSGADLIRRVGRGSGAVQRQLEALHGAALVTVTRVGNQKLYQANRRSPVFEELRRLLMKTVGVVGLLRDALMTHREEIAIALVFGSMASGKADAESDVDLLVVKRAGAALDHATLYESLAPVESQLGREIAPVLMTEAAWRQKRRRKDSFAARVDAGEQLIVFGEEDVVGGIP
jgi:predicted nucleotidyltransferase